MGKKPHLILALLALACIQPSGGMVVFGNRDCAKWLQKDNDYLRIGSQGWLLGYLSGQNRVLDAVKDKKFGDALEQVKSAEQIYLWMDNYCTKTPLSDVAEGADQLMLELMKKVR